MINVKRSLHMVLMLLRKHGCQDVSSWVPYIIADTGSRPYDTSISLLIVNPIPK